MNVAVLKLVADLDGMAQVAPVDPVRQQRNASKSAASNFFVAANCQLIGPSLSFSSVTRWRRSAQWMILPRRASAGWWRSGPFSKDKSVRRFVVPLGEGLGLFAIHRRCR